MTLRIAKKERNKVDIFVEKYPLKEKPFIAHLRVASSYTGAENNSAVL